MNYRPESRLAYEVRSVLLVDDDAFLLSLVADIASTLGVSDISLARDGDAALAAFDCLPKPPDCVVCDLQMPRSDGFQFMEALADRDYRGRVVLLSGMDERTMRSAGLMGRFHQLDIVAALTKPLDRSAFASALRRHPRFEVLA